MATDEPLLASVAGRYASALFELASENGQIAEIEADLAKVQSAIDASADFARMIRSPVISADDQARALSAVLAKLGVGSTTANFFGVLARNRRLFTATDVVRSFRALAAKARGEVLAEVTSATALTEAQLAELRAILKSSVGKDVKVAAKVDPSILGGLVVKVGSRMVDSSLKTKLSLMRHALRGTA